MKKTALVWCWSGALMLAACGGGVDGGGGGGADGGTGGAPDSGQNPPPGPTTLTVSGKVVDGAGKPLANAAVLILGQTPVTADATGAFRITGVTAPYDIVAVNGGKQAAVVYKGVTRADPTLALTTRASTTSYSALVKGPITGAQKPSTTVGTPQVAFVAKDGSGAFSMYDNSTSTYSLNVSWYEGPTNTGTLYAFQGERTTATSGYTRYLFGRRDNVSLSDNATVSSQSIALSSVANSTLAGTVTAPPGLTLSERYVNMSFASDPADFLLFSDSSSTPSFSYAVPVVAQGMFSITGLAVSSEGAVALGFKSGLAAGNNDVSLALKAPPALSVPLDKATQVTRASEFAWGGLSETIHTASFVQKTSFGTPSPYTITVITSGGRTTIPDLSALGMALPASTVFTWQVSGRGPIGSVDQFLGGRGSTGIPAGQTELHNGTSVMREFTTASAP